MEHYKNMIAGLSSNLLSSQPGSKMTAQLLVGVSVVSSLLLSFSSLCSSSPLIMYSENLRYSFEMIVGRATSKSCVFLICNGLLVFLAKTTSGVVRSPSGTFDPNDVLRDEIGDGLETAAVTEPEPEAPVEVSEIPEMGSLEKDIAVWEEKSECKEEGDDDDDRRIETKEVITEITPCLEAEIGDDGEKHARCLSGDEQRLTRREEDDDDRDEEVHGEEAEEEEHAYEMEKMSTEELNKKFEDFIRRMKQVFRINNVNEAARRQQLVMVN